MRAWICAPRARNVAIDAASDGFSATQRTISGISARDSLSAAAPSAFSNFFGDLFGPARSSYFVLPYQFHRHCRRRASALQGAARVTSACARRRQSRLDRLTRRGAPPRRRRSGYSRGPRTCQIKATPSPSCMSFAVLLMKNKSFARRDGMRTTTHISIFIPRASHPGC